MQGFHYAQYDLAHLFLDLARSPKLQGLPCIEGFPATFAENPVLHLPPVGPQSLLRIPALKHVYPVVFAIFVRTVGKRQAQLEKVAPPAREIAQLDLSEKVCPQYSHLNFASFVSIR